MYSGAKRQLIYEQTLPFIQNPQTHTSLWTPLKVSDPLIVFAVWSSFAEWKLHYADSRRGSPAMEKFSKNDATFKNIALFAAPQFFFWPPRHSAVTQLNQQKSGQSRERRAMAAKRKKETNSFASFVGTERTPRGESVWIGLPGAGIVRLAKLYIEVWYQDYPEGRPLQSRIQIWVSRFWR